MENTNELATERAQFEGLITDLIANKYAFSNDFLNNDTVTGLRSNIKEFQKSGEMTSAGLGKKSDYHQNQKVRGDNIKWLESKSEDPYEMIFLNKINQFILYLNETCFTSILEFESHYASYQEESFYKRHLDQFKHDKGRKFSIIMYLNDAWLEKDGGLLSLYPQGSDQIDISPIGGRMVFFKSDEMEHEVHPSMTRERISIAGWMKS